MLQGFTWCASNTPYTSPFSIFVSGTVLHPRHRTISPGLFGPVHQIRLAAPFTSTVLRPRFQLCSPSPSPQPFSILVSGTVLRPRHRRRPLSSSPLPSSILVSGTILHPRPRNCPSSSSPEPFSIPVHRTISPGLFGPVHQIRLAAPFTSTVLRPRFQLCSPSPSPQPFSILVPGTILHPRHRRRPLSSSQEPFSVLRSSFPKPSSILVSGTVLRPRPRNCPSSSSPEPFSIPVHRTISPELFRPVHQIRLAAPFTSTVLHSRLRNRPPSSLRYRPPSSSPEPSSIPVFSRPVFLM